MHTNFTYPDLYKLWVIQEKLILCLYIWVSTFQANGFEGRWVVYIYLFDYNDSRNAKNGWMDAFFSLVSIKRYN